MSRPRARGSRDKNQLELAIALSTSLEESKARELSKQADELPADAIENGAIPHNIKQMQEELLNRLKPVTGARSKRQGTRTDPPIPVLFTRSSGERMRIITEKVALILIKDSDDEAENDPRMLNLDCYHKTPLWDISFLETPIEERNCYYIPKLSEFISPADGAVSAIPKYRPLPGRFLTPQKREPIVETPSKMSSAKKMYEFPATIAQDPVPLHNEALLEFQNDWLVMLDNPMMSDILIYTKSTPLPAHKLVLYARCPVILKDLDDSGSLRWVGVSRPAAVLFLEFIYSGRLRGIEPWMEEAEGVRHLAKKYCVVALLTLLLDPTDIGIDSKCEPDKTLVGKEWGRSFSPKISSLQPPILSDKSIKVLDTIEISSDDSITFERRKSPLTFSRTPHDSPKMPNESKQNQEQESSKTSVTNDVTVSDEGEVPSPFKCTLLNFSDLSNPNPATPKGECLDGQASSSSTFKRNIFETSPMSDNSLILASNSQKERCMLNDSPASNDSIILPENSKHKLLENARCDVTKSQREALKLSLEGHFPRKHQDPNSTRKRVTKGLWLDSSDEEEIQPNKSYRRELRENGRGGRLKSNRRTLQFSPKSDDLQGHSQRKLQDPNSTRKRVTKGLCIVVSDEEEIQPLNKSSRSDVNALENWKPVREHQSSDDGLKPCKESLKCHASQLSDSEPEVPERDDPFEIAGKSSKYSPPKASRSNSNAVVQDYKAFLEDSFRFDLRTPPLVRPTCTTPMRTPLTDIKTSSPATPMPDYWAMSGEELQAELCKYGLKRNLPISKGIKMLKHIYLKLHPLVEVVVKGGRELFIPIGDKTPGADLPSSKSLPSAIPKEVDEPPESPDDVHLSSDSSSDESEVMEESMFADEDIAGCEGLADLTTMVRKWISRNQDLHEKVLRYGPIWLERLHSELKEYTHKNIKLSHLMKVLDEEGVAFRTTSTEGGRTKTQRTKKRKNACGEEFLQSKKPKEYDEL